MLLLTAPESRVLGSTGTEYTERKIGKPYSMDNPGISHNQGQPNILDKLQSGWSLPGVGTGILSLVHYKP